MTDVLYLDSETGEYYSEEEYNQISGDTTELPSYTYDDEPSYLERAGQALYSSGTSTASGMLQAGVGIFNELDHTADQLSGLFGGGDTTLFSDEAQNLQGLSDLNNDRAESSLLQQRENADSLFNQATGVIPQVGAVIANAPLAIVSLALGAGGNKYRDIIEAGGSETEAKLGGLTAGAIDSATNFMAGRFLPSATGRGWSQIGKTALTEGVEEGTSELLDIGLDGVLPSLDMPTLEQGIQRVGTASLLGGLTGGALERGRQSITSKPVRSKTYSEQEPEVQVELDIEQPRGEIEQLALGSSLSSDVQYNEQGVPVPKQLETAEQQFDRQDTVSLNEPVAYLGKVYKQSVFNTIQNSTTILKDHTYLIQDYQASILKDSENGFTNTTVNDYADYLEAVKPTTEDLTALENQDFQLTEEDLSIHFEKIAKEGQEVITVDNLPSPVFDENIPEDFEIDVDELVFDVEETKIGSQIRVTDKYGSQRGAVINPFRSDPESKMRRKQAKILERRVESIKKEVIGKNQKDSLERALRSDFYQSVVIPQEVKRQARLSGQIGVAESIEIGQDVQNQTIQNVNESLDIAKPFYDLSEESSVAIGEALIKIRQYEKANPNAVNIDKETLFRNATVKNPDGTTRKFTEEEVQGALSLQKTSNHNLKKILRTDRDNKIDTIDNNLESAKKKLGVLKRQKKLTDETYTKIIGELNKFRANTVNKLTNSVNTKYEEMIKKTYMPLTRRGDFIVGVTSGKDNLVEYHMVESKKEQNKLLEKLIRDNPDKSKEDFFIQERIDEPNMGDPYYSVPTPILHQMAQSEVETNFELLTNQLDQTISDTASATEKGEVSEIQNQLRQLKEEISGATRYYREKLKTTGKGADLGLKGRFVEPTFVKGWSKDHKNSYSRFINQSANFVSGARAHSFIMREANKLPEGKTRKYLLNYAKNTFRRESTKFDGALSAIKSATYYNYLGFFNTSSAITNAVSGGMMLSPMLDLQLKNNGIKKSTTKTILKAGKNNTSYFTNKKGFKDSLLKKGDKESQDLLALVEIAEKQGIFSSNFYSQFISDMNAETGVASGVKGLVKKTDVFFRASESLLKGQTLFSSFEATANQGLSVEQRLKMAKDLTRETAGDFSRGNRPFITNNNVASLGLMFRNWQFQYVNNIRRMLEQVPKDKGKSVLLYAGVTGIVTGWHKSIPFLSDSLDMLSQLGVDYGELEEFVGEKGMDIFHYGLASQQIKEEYGDSPQISNSGGGAGLLPRVDLSKSPLDTFAKTIGGAPVGKVMDFYYGYQSFNRGNQYKALETIAPSSIRKKMRAFREKGLVEGEDSGIRNYANRPIFDEKGEKPLEHDLSSFAFSLLGVPSINNSEGYRRYYTARVMANSSKNGWLNAWVADTVHNGDDSAINKMWEKIDKHNKNAGAIDRWNVHMPTVKKIIKGYNVDPVSDMTGVRKDVRAEIYDKVTER